MEIKVGAYTVNGEFKNRKQAKEVFMQHFPAVTEADLDVQLDNHFANVDKSDNTSKEVTEGDTGNRKDNSTVAKGGKK